MKFLRNPEVMVCVIIYCTVTVIATAVALTRSDRMAVCVFLLCAVLFAVYLISTSKRYKKICRLSDDLDKILHGQGGMTFEQYSEGELAILQSEIYKMTVRLREQQAKLIEDKTYLADSIADISHQIRTPLTSINLLVSFLSEPGLSEQRRLKLTKELSEMLSRIDWLISSLLKISKLDAGAVTFKNERIPLKKIIDTACEPLLVPIELRGQELVINAEGYLSGDLKWTCEAVGNIVKNCMEHTPAGGTLKIEAFENSIYSGITVSDTGSGIDKEDLPHIFERFYKGKNSDDKSVGIGLALARMIVVSQNGTIKAENLPHKGARFSIRFYKVTV